MYSSEMFHKIVNQSFEENAQEGFNVNWSGDKQNRMPKDGLGLNNLQRQLTAAILIYGENGKRADGSPLFTREDPTFLKLPPQTHP